MKRPKTAQEVNDRIRHCAETGEPYAPIECIRCGYKSSESLAKTVSIVDGSVWWKCPKCGNSFYSGQVVTYLYEVKHPISPIFLDESLGEEF